MFELGGYHNVLCCKGLLYKKAFHFLRTSLQFVFTQCNKLHRTRIEKVVHSVVQDQHAQSYLPSECRQCVADSVVPDQSSESGSGAILSVYAQ